jgi:hypothetical protein
MALSNENPFILYHKWLLTQSQQDVIRFENFDWKDQKLNFASVAEQFPDGRNEYPQPNWTNKPIAVCGLAGTGRSFLSQIVSCHPTLGGDKFLLACYNNLDSETFFWDKHTSDFYEPRVVRLHSDDVDFEDIPKYYKFVHIKFDNEPDEIIMMQKRLTHIHSTRMHRERSYANLQVKYNRVLQNFLRNDWKKHFEFPFMHFFNSNKFCNTVIKMFEYLELEPLDKTIIKKLFKLWVAANLKHLKQFEEAAVKFSELKK